MSTVAPPRPSPPDEVFDPEALIEAARRRTRRRRARYATLLVAAAALVGSIVWRSSVQAGAHGVGRQLSTGQRTNSARRASFGLALDPATGTPRTTRLVRLRPGTLEPVGRSVDLRTSVRDWAVAPDGGSVAFGGGKIVLADLRHMRRSGAIRIAGAFQVDITAWPTARHLVALAYTRRKGGTPLLGEVLEVDPVSRHVTVRRRFEGLADIQTSWGSSGWPVAVLLAPHGGIGPARLLIVRRDGSVGAVTLLRIRSNMFTTMPGLAVGARRAFVAGTGSLLAEVDLRTLAVRYHHVPHLRRLAVGGSGPDRVVGVVRAVTLRPGGRVELRDDIARPQPPGSMPSFTGVDMQTFHPVVVDTRTWRIALVVPSSSEAVPKLQVGDVLVGDDDGALRAYDLGGKQLWSKKRVAWSVVGDTLTGSRVPRSGVAPTRYIDPRTGHWLRPLGPAEENVLGLCGGFGFPSPPPVDRGPNSPLVCGL